MRFLAKTIVYSKSKCALLFSSTFRLLTGVNLRNTKISDVRNIGIVAHIDAGKTTVTERMLYYAGAQRRIGDVDKGNTTTDFMQEEMDRGITIQSAAVTFPWKGKVINLIDTPGHVDFNMEVERSLRVLEGVIGVFDAAVGVQGQSHVVLQQARKHTIPMIAFINKMDKPNAKFDFAVGTLAEKLGVCPICLQGPIGNGFEGFEGIIDFLTMQAMRWVMPDGRDIKETPISSEPQYVQDLATAGRLRLVDTLLNRDEVLMEAILQFMEDNACDEQTAKLTIHRDALINAIRRQCRIVTHKKDAEAPQIVPVLCGAARRNIGVQPLLDFTLELLPCPSQVRTAEQKSLQRVPNAPHALFNFSTTTALVFKVSYHVDAKAKRRGLLSFFRVYDGRVTRGKYYNTTRGCVEDVSQVYVVHGDAIQSVDVVPVGCIGVTFSETSFTGDTWVNESAKNEAFHLPGIDTPRPVVSSALEPFADNHAQSIQNSLLTLCREDPSLQTKESSRGEIILQGMGDLHLEIAMSKMERMFGVRCALQQAMIEYHEAVCTPLEIKGEILRGASGADSIELGMRIEPLRDDADDTVIPACSAEVDVDLEFDAARRDLKESHSPEEINRIIQQSAVSLNRLLPCIVGTIQKALANSPRMHIDLLGARVTLTRVIFYEERMLPDSVESKVSFFMSKALRALKTLIVEPYMKLEVSIADAQYTSAVVQDLRSRGAKTLDASDEGDTVVAVLSMAKLRGYSAVLRRITKGHAQYWYKLDHYREIVRTS